MEKRKRQIRQWRTEWRKENESCMGIYKCNEHIFLNKEDFLKECIDEVIGSEKIMLIDDERKLINKLLNLSGLEINNYIKKLLNGIRFV